MWEWVVSSLEVLTCGDVQTSLVGVVVVSIILWSLFVIARPHLSPLLAPANHEPKSRATRVDCVETRTSVLVNGRRSVRMRRRTTVGPQQQPMYPVMQRRRVTYSSLKPSALNNPYLRATAQGPAHRHPLLDDICPDCGKEPVEQSCCHELCRKCCDQCPSYLDSFGKSNTFDFSPENKPTHLDLSFNGMSACPSSLCLVGGQLTVLNLSNNQLKSLPSTIGLLSGLRELYLQENFLSSVPFSIGELSELTDVDLKGNQLYTLPDVFENLCKLKYLDLNDNNLTSLPPSIGRLSALVFLDIENNSLCKLPEHIGGLRSLRVLHLKNNRLRELPELIGGMKLLEDLDVSRNMLQMLPAGLSCCVGVRSINLDDNKLERIPWQLGRLPALRYFGLRRNKLTALPSTLQDLQQLSRFAVMENPLADSSDWVARQHLSPQPSESGCVIPSLFELTARYFVINHIPYSPLDLSLSLCEALCEADQCFRCAVPIVTQFQTVRSAGNILDQGPYPLVSKYCLACHRTLSS